LIIKKYFVKKVLEYSDAKEALEYLQDDRENIAELPQVILIDVYANDVGL